MAGDDSKAGGRRVEVAEMGVRRVKVAGDGNKSWVQKSGSGRRW